VPGDWSDFFIVADSGGESPGGVRGGGREGADESEQDAGVIDGASTRAGFIRRLRESMARTRRALGSEIQATLFSALDEQAWERLEEALIMADVGAATTAAVVSTLEGEAGAGALEGGEALRERLIVLLAQAAQVGDGRLDVRARPTVIMTVGVNGSGKTTTMGKLAWQLRHELGLSALLAAADTFRAAAGEQLQGWGRRAGCEVVVGAPRSDPGAVAFEAIARARSEGVDVVLIDTAGRLHTHAELMAELEKVRRVIARQLPGAPQETLLTLDASTGQNGLRQASVFAEAVPLSGVVLTKLDGTARGGIALAIARELALPVKLIGIGETVADLRPFEPLQYARALIAER